MSVAEQNKKDTELMYSLLTEGKLDLMYLPAGAIAWLWDRPVPQMHAARDLAVAAKDICPVTDAAVLRSDQNVLILKCEDGNKFNVYPDGGYGCNGEPLDIHGCIEMLDNGMRKMDDEECPMEDESSSSGDQPDAGEWFTYDGIAAAAGDEVIATMEAKEDWWGEREWRQEMERLRAEGALTPEVMDAIKDKIRQAKRSHMEPKGNTFEFESEGEQSIIDRDRQQRFVDDLCKTRSVGSQFMKNLDIGEAVGSGPINVRWHARDEPTKPLHGWDFADEKDVMQVRGKKPLTWREYVKWYAEEGPALRIWVNGNLVWDYEHGWHKDSGMEEGVGSGGQQGIAGPIGTDLFDFEDELAQIGAFVEEELKKHRD